MKEATMLELLIDELSFCFACDENAVPVYCAKCDTQSDCSVCGCVECGEYRY